jgi:hypothetical protein
MENFSREIIDLICDDWENDEQLVIDALVYLYNTTTDDKMIEQIEMVCKDYYGCCPDCCNKLSTYEWCETHTELEYNNQEWFSCQMCSCCDRGEIEDYMKEVK